jgi:hypothetical protein
VPKTYIGEKIASSTDSAGKTGYPQVERLKLNASHLAQISIQNGAKTLM